MMYVVSLWPNHRQPGAEAHDDLMSDPPARAHHIAESGRSEVHILVARHGLPPGTPKAHRQNVTAPPGICSR